MNKKDIEIIKSLQTELKEKITEGFGPFIAAIYDENYNLISKAQNDVVIKNCSNNHAEINAITLAEKKLKTYNLAPFNFGIYITSEPCMMCLGAIFWSGIKRIYYSVPSCIVEKITGFDEGFKPNWINECKKRKIEVYGNILQDEGICNLEKYVKSKGVIYKPKD